MNEPFEFLPLILALVSLLSMLLNYFKCIMKIQERLSSLETKMDLFWKGVSNKIADSMMSPDHPEKDILLLKLKNQNASSDEVKELKAILELEMLHLKEEEEYLLNYIILINYLDLLIYEDEKRKK